MLHSKQMYCATAFKVFVSVSSCHTLILVISYSRFIISSSVNSAQQLSTAFPCFDLTGLRHESDRYPTMHRPVFTTAKLRDAVSWT